jgi:hypothetical protein
MGVWMRGKLKNALQTLMDASGSTDTASAIDWRKLLIFKRIYHG